MKIRIAALALAAVLVLASCGQSHAVNESEYVYPQLIAHAGGAIWGYRYTNSLEAINAAYAAGFRYIELDFELTSDGSIVLIHDWEAMAERMLFSEGVRTREEFLSSPTFMRLTLLDAAGLKKWMDSHDDCYIITDVKVSHNAAVLRKLKQELGKASERLIPQIYSTEQYDEVRALGFSNIILTVYKMDADGEKLSAFIRDHELWAVTIAFSRLTEEFLGAVKSAGRDTAVYAHTVNTLSDFENWKPLGLTGIYTDYFVPTHWNS